jgi:integrase
MNKSPKFYQVCDNTTQKPIPGLWLRQGRFYLAVTVPGKGTRRLALLTPTGDAVGSLEEAITAKNGILADRKAGSLQSLQSPRLRAYALHYIEWLTTTKAKSPLTILKENAALDGWVGEYGQKHIAFLTLKDLNDYAEKRMQSGVSTRTVNLDVLALGNLLDFAKREALVTSNIVDTWHPLKYTAPRRSLVTCDQIQALVTEARSLVPTREVPVTRDERWVPKYLNGNMLADLILFMAYSGARRQAALTAKWEHVDFENRQLTLFTKFDKRVVVDMNPKLEAHLRDMHSRGAERLWIFPSPTGAGPWINPGPLKDFVAKAAGVPGFRFHDLRSYFASHAIMSGIDTLTVATWLGHADGGVLIGKVYGHLNPQHRRESAQRVSF